MSDQDTDLLVAIVASLLSPGASTDTATVLNALTESNGDAQAAANSLNRKVKGASTSRSPAPRSGPGKRKRDPQESGLDAWFQKPRSKSQPSPDESTSYSPPPSGESSSSSQLTSPVKKPRSSTRPVANLMDILKQPPTKPASKLHAPPPLLLGTPALIAQHTPCTLHLSVLPPELACRLFYVMIGESQTWSRNKWWLFDRVVESPHLTSFYAREDADGRKEEARFWYNGRKMDAPRHFPPEMEEACKIIERVVNTEMRKRKRFNLEWAGTNDDDKDWRANVAASNCYRGSKESVGFHSDQLTYLGPYPTIASLSLGTTRAFRLREVIPTSEVETRSAQTYSMPLAHNSLTIMHASCQERYKHTIPPQSSLDLFRPPYPPPDKDESDIEPSNCRINITFRFYRPDFNAKTIPKCRCGVPMILRADMKNRTDGETDRYWWNCYAGAQNEGKGCNQWTVMDMKAEGRGPVLGDLDRKI